MPGALLIGGLCPLALLCERWTARLLQVPIKGALRDWLDMLLQAGALIGDKDLAGFLLFGASIPLCNRLIAGTAGFLGGFWGAVVPVGGWGPGALADHTPRPWGRR